MCHNVDNHHPNMNILHLTDFGEIRSVSVVKGAKSPIIGLIQPKFKENEWIWLHFA